MDYTEVIQKDSPAPVDPTVYRDILIFEESLRSQYLYLQKRRRKYLGKISSNSTNRTLSLRFRPFILVRIFHIWDNNCPKSGTFPKVSHLKLKKYYYIHLFHRLSLLGGILTLILYYVSSLLHRTLIYPKKYLPHTNKSLRQFNLKLVPNPISNPWRNLPLLRWIFRSKPSLGEGGVKVVLNQRGAIEGEFIEGWEMFREDYWEEEEKEKERRSGEN